MMPDGKQIIVKTWREVAVATVTWIADNHCLPQLPFVGRKGGSLYLLNARPEQPNGPMRSWVPLSFDGRDVFLDTWLSASEFVRQLTALCEASGVSAEEVAIQIAPGPRWATPVGR